MRSKRHNITTHLSHNGNQIFSIQMKRGNATITHRSWHHEEPNIPNPHAKEMA